MNKNIEVINENLWAVNSTYIKMGYIKELLLLQELDDDKIMLSKEGIIVLDKDSPYYPLLQKNFIKAMEKSPVELVNLIEKDIRMNEKMFADDFCKNVIGWEIIRRCVKAEYFSAGSDRLAPEV